MTAGAPRPPLLMFIVRLATALALAVSCAAALLLLANPWWMLLLLAVLAVGSWEWGALAGFSNALRSGYAVLVVGSALMIGSLATGSAPGAASRSAAEYTAYGLNCAFWGLIAIPWLALRRNVTSPFALGVSGWIVLVPTWLALTRLQLEPERLLALLGVVWVADTAAYLSGKAWGTHRLAPSISPAKTWEGVAGAAVAVAVYYAVLSQYTPGWRGWQGWGGALLFAGVAALSVVGDLFESWIKRQAGAKDSGKLLPGHGGVLDRIDTMTAAMPFAALILLHTT